MDRLSLSAEERSVLGKKVKKLRRDGFVPGHVFGNNVETEHVSVGAKEFMAVYNQAGETGLIDLKVGAEKVRPVMVRGAQYDPRSGYLLHIDFYQVNLHEKVTVPVPIVIKEMEGEIEAVKTGEVVVLQTVAEVQVEALPTDLVDQIEVDISGLKNVDDAITVKDLVFDRSKLTILAEEDEVVVKLAPAVTEEMKALMEEQAAEVTAAAAAEETVEGAEGEAEKVEGEVTEGEQKEEGGEKEEKKEAKE